MKGGLEENESSEPEKRTLPKPRGSKEGNSGDQDGASVARVEERILDSAKRLVVLTQVDETVGDLIRLAETGDPLMVVTLHSVAVKVISALNSLTTKKPGVVRAIARNEFCWPALIGKKRFIKELNKRLIKCLHLGEGATFSTRAWQLSAPSTEAALDLLLTARMYEEDWSLPPLAKSNKLQWFEVAWKKC